MLHRKSMGWVVGRRVPHHKSAKGHVPQWKSVSGDFPTLQVNKRVISPLEITEWNI